MVFFYQANALVNLVVYINSDLAESADDSKNTSGYVFDLKSGAIAWCSQKQPMVALFITKIEYIAAFFARCHLLWLRGILEKLKHVQIGPTTLFYDNSLTISISKDPILHGETKYIRIRYYLLRELVNEGVVHVEYCRTNEQKVDIFTKTLGGPTFTKIATRLGMKSKFGLGETLLEL